MSRIPTQVYHPPTTSKVVYRPQNDLFVITLPHGRYASGGQKLLSSQVEITGGSLAAYTVYRKHQGEPNRQQRFVWRNGGQGKIEFCLSDIEGDELTERIKSGLMQRSVVLAIRAFVQSDEYAEIMRRDTKAPPP